MSRFSIRLILFVIAWFAAMAGSLQIANLDLGHSICGPWGCGPPASALLSMHLLWFSGMVLPVWFAVRHVSRSLRALGFITMVVSGVGLIGLGIWDLVEYVDIYRDGYVFQRYFFSLVTQIDLPLVPLMLSGAVAVFCSTPCPCCSDQEIVENENYESPV